MATEDHRFLRFDHAVCRDLEVAARREWLETNGIGGYASSTIVGLNTRRYHGLLVAATRPPVGRMVLLAKIEETLVCGGRRVELGVNRYPGVVHPQGHLRMREFRLDPFPVFVWEIDGIEVEKSVWMIRGSNATVIQYRVRGAGAGTLELRPLVAFRGFHDTTHENGALDPRLEISEGMVKIAPYAGVPPLYFAHGGEVEGAGCWYRNFEYDRERERGLEYREDLYQPFVLSYDLGRNAEPRVVAATEPRSLEGEPPREPFRSALERAADQFIVRRGDGYTVIAGYHWFGDWGRDTMIALAGLALATGRYDVARGILVNFAAHVDRGMLPNRFPDAGETPEYNTVDATLWFFEAARALAAATGDFDFIRDKLYGVLAEIVAWHERGTRYGIHVDDDGLVWAGEPGVQLTWMDAKVGNWVVTPRTGKPVEVEALWHNALGVMEDFAARFGRASERAHYGELARRARESFERTFWNEAAGCLYDVVNGGERDGSIRPNQIFAVSLEHTMLGPERARSVVEVVRRELLTPYGLRTLAPGDPRYRGRYEGDPVSRDGAYHQGTVWPWLLGPFLTAYLKVNGRSAEAQRQADEWMAELRRYADAEGVGQIPEVFDGDAPQRAGGCIAQAWSVAEMLRVGGQGSAACGN